MKIINNYFHLFILPHHYQKITQNFFVQNEFQNFENILI